MANTVVQQPQPYAGQPWFPHAYAAKEYSNWFEELADVTNKWLPVVHVFPYKMACMSYLLFDIEEYFIDETQTTTQLMLKVKWLWDGRSPVKVLTNEECWVERWEEIHWFDFTTVASDVTNGNVIPVVDASRLKGIHPNTRIRFETNASTNPVTVIWLVTAVASNNITLSQNVTVKAWDKVFRWANIRKRCADINNSFASNKRAKYISHFQSLQGHLEYETCEISQDRSVYYTAWVGSKWSQALVDQKANQMFENLLKVDFLDMFLYAENQAQWTWATDAAWTRGALSTLQEAQDATGKAYIYDMTPAIWTTDDEKMIATLIAIWVKAFNSGYYNNEPITSIINSAQMTQLMFMAPAFEEFFWIQMYRENSWTHQGCRDYVSLRVHGIEIDHWTIEFVLFSPLDYFYDSTPMMILLPKSCLAMYQRKSTKLDWNMKVIQEPENYPKFTIKDVSMFVAPMSWWDECFKYVTKLEVALAFLWMFNDAVYVLKNAKSFRDSQTGAVSMTNLVSTLIA